MPAYSTTTLCNSSSISVAFSLPQFIGSIKFNSKPDLKSHILYYGGNYKITGVATRAGVATQRKVLLFVRKGHIPIQEKLSNIDGTYEFKFIKYIVDGYYIVEFDDPTLAQPYNAAIADFVTPVPM